MEIITGIELNKKFKQIPEYKMDLGLSIKIDDSKNKEKYKSSGGIWKIKDKTIKKYHDTFGKFLNRIGKIGTLLFYIDYNINNNDMYIIHENELYKSTYDNSNIRTFLSNTIKNVIDNKLEPYMEIKSEKEEFVDLRNMTNDELASYFAKKSKSDI